MLKKQYSPGRQRRLDAILAITEIKAHVRLNFLGAWLGSRHSPGSVPVGKRDHDRNKSGTEPSNRAGIRTSKMTHSALNINLIIPFKDNKGERLNLVIREIDAYSDQLESQVAQFRDELDGLFSGNCELTIAGRSDGNAKKYYWRFKSNKQDRKYNRLQAESVLGYLSRIGERQKLRIKEIEGDLILINANFKILKGMKDAIAQSAKEKRDLLEIGI